MNAQCVVMSDMIKSRAINRSNTIFCTKPIWGNTRVKIDMISKKNQLDYIRIGRIFDNHHRIKIYECLKSDIRWMEMGMIHAHLNWPTLCLPSYCLKFHCRSCFPFVIIALRKHFNPNLGLLGSTKDTL